MEFKYENDRIFAEDTEGNVIAEVTFPIIDGTAIINHTFVDSSLRGQGIADLLLSSATEYIRKRGLKAKPTCSYAVKWFVEHPESDELM